MGCDYPTGQGGDFLGSKFSAADCGNLKRRSGIYRPNANKLGVGMMMNIGINMNVFWGIACIILAIKTPRFLSEFMVSTGGGGSGVVNNVYHSVRLVGMAKNMMK